MQWSIVCSPSAVQMLVVAAAARHGSSLTGQKRGGDLEGGEKKGLTYEVACHMLQKEFRKRIMLAMYTVSQLEQGEPGLAACARRAPEHITALGSDQGNSLRPRRGLEPIGCPSRKGFSTYRSTAIYACCRNARTQG